MSESIAWKAESAEGQSLSGTLDAVDARAAGEQLSRLGLRVLEVASATPRAARPLSAEDFHSFNLQLAQLTAAGLPLESGLRLIARDMRSGALSRAVNEVATDLESGVPLSEAFDRRRGRFPMLYGRLLDAGVRMGNLPAMLLSLGEHLQLVQRLRASLWSVLSYPAVVLVALAVVLLMLSFFVQPQLVELWAGFAVELPLAARASLALLGWIPWLIVAGLLVVLIFSAVWLFYRGRGQGQAFIDYAIVPLPFVGRVVHRSLLSRWCHAVALGIEAGQDLPTAISLAAQAAGSPRIERDAGRLIAILSAGGAIDAVGKLETLPATVPATMQLGSATGNLAGRMRSLSDMYQRQAQYGTQALPAILTPMLLIVIGALIGISVLGLFLPLVALFNALMGQ
jgi:type IV pilus assembly protein PilC